MGGGRFSEKDMRQSTNLEYDAASLLVIIYQLFYVLRLLQEYKIDRESSRKMTIDTSDDFPNREHCADCRNNVSQYGRSAGGEVGNKAAHDCAVLQKKG